MTGLSALAERLEYQRAGILRQTASIAASQPNVVGCLAYGIMYRFLTESKRLGGQSLFRTTAAEHNKTALLPSVNVALA